jgi:hypothetical protein
MKDNQRKGFFPHALCIYKCLSRDRKTMDHLLCISIKNWTNYFKRIFLYSHLSCKYINIYFFIIWIYFTLAYLYIIYIFEYKRIFSLFLTTQHSINECKWTSIISDRLPDWILCNHHLLMLGLSDIFYLYIQMTRWRNNLFHTELSSMPFTSMRTFHIYKNASLNHVCVCICMEGIE